MGLQLVTCSNAASGTGALSRGISFVPVCRPSPYHLAMPPSCYCTIASSDSSSEGGNTPHPFDLGPDHVVRDAAIPLRRDDGAVTQQMLKGGETTATFQLHANERVPQVVVAERLLAAASTRTLHVGVRPPILPRPSPSRHPLDAKPIRPLGDGARRGTREELMSSLVVPPMLEVSRSRR